MTRIIDKIKERRKQLKALEQTASSNGKKRLRCFYYSFEFFPPKTEAGLDNLLTRMDRMAQRLDPLFIDVTWGGTGSNEVRCLEVAGHAQKYLGLDVLLHLAAQGMQEDDLRRVLDQAKLLGIQNILALRGDPPRGKRIWEIGDVSGGFCDRAIDLVRFIRQNYGDFFGIAVAGHPEGHPSSTSPEQEMKHLKEKLEAGADFIITQFFYDTDIFIAYVKRCRDSGIDCPILPGIMPIQSFSSFSRMTKYCNTAVPDELWKRLEPVKGDDEAIKDIGCDIATDMCRRILEEAPGVDGVHFYTLNLERSVTRILMEMGAIGLVHPQVEGDKQESLHPEIDSIDPAIRTTSGRALPWRPSALQSRAAEQVRPINWANRPKSYVKRTEDWDEFPNGRWGVSSKLIVLCARDGSRLSYFSTIMYRTLHLQRLENFRISVTFILFH